MKPHVVPKDPVKVALAARNVAWDWKDLPLQWIPGELFASHMINVMHLLLPEGERWFVRLFSEALPLITDEQLREDVIGFIGQEGVHASAHQGLQDYFTDNGLDVTGYVNEIEHVFQKILGDRDLKGRRKEEWLIERVALVAGIEHLTAFLGNWILNSPGLDQAEADPRVLDLLRWHGAEEVEHRAVAFDLYNHLDGRYNRRARTYVLAMAYLSWLWIRGARYLISRDPDNQAGTTPTVRKARWRDLVISKRKGLTPGYLDFVAMTYRYLLPNYHPRHEGSTSQAVAYLAKSPAALAADAHAC